MAFGNVLSSNPTGHALSEAGVILAKLNELFQQDGKDFKINLSTDGNDYMRFNSTLARFEWYINGVLQGHLDATAFAAD